VKDVKTSGNLTVNGITVGRGGGNESTNTAIGFDALSVNAPDGDNDLGINNTAIGMNALLGNITGANNTATGRDALFNNTTGLENAATGAYALFNNTTGSFNTAYGKASLLINTEGSNNTAIGYGADVASSSLTNATAIGSGAKVYGDNTIVLGNANVTDVQTAGSVYAAAFTAIELLNGQINDMASFGVNGLVTSGTLTAGDVSYTNIKGNDGDFLKIDGSGNSSWAPIPSPDLTNYVTTNSVQTITEAKTFSKDLTVNEITVGKGAGNVSTNTASGFEALSLNTTGSFNTANGYRTLSANTTGYNNTATGADALTSNTTGLFNTAYGSSTLLINSTGYGNTAIGTKALINNETGTLNTAIGYDAGVSSSNKDLTNTTAIGNGARVTESNTIQLGSSTGSTTITKVNTSGTVFAFAFSSTSDLRLKSNITPLENSLATVMQLNPVHYMKKGSLASTAYTREENGFIAQEIQKILPFVVTEGSDENKLLSVDYNSFIPMLTKAIQEQQKQIEDQNAKIAAQQKQTEDQNAKIAAQQKQIEELIKLVKGQ
jgi:hypothetical protein